MKIFWRLIVYSVRLWVINHLMITYFPDKIHSYQWYFVFGQGILFIGYVCLFMTYVWVWKHQKRKVRKKNESRNDHSGGVFDFL